MRYVHVNEMNIIVPDNWVNRDLRAIILFHYVLYGIIAIIISLYYDNNNGNKNLFPALCMDVKEFAYVRVYRMAESFIST